MSDEQLSSENTASEPETEEDEASKDVSMSYDLDVLDDTTHPPRKGSRTTRFSLQAPFSEKKTPTSRLSKSSDRASFSEKKISKAVTEYMKQRRKSAASEVTERPDDNVEIIPTEDEKDKRAVKSFQPKDRRYSKAIQGLEKEKDKKKSLISSSSLSSEDLQKKHLRFEADTESASLSKGMKIQFEQTPKPCQKFMTIEDFSETFIDDILQEALLKTHSIKIESAMKIVEGFSYRSESDESSSSITSIGTYICTFDWPTIESFTVEIGANKIMDYLSYWELKENWKYSVNYLKYDRDDTCDLHRYEAIFGIPCKQYPICQATASVFFTIEVSRVKPRECLVDVYYSFEGRRLVHTPGQYKMQEEWLFHIVDAKLNFFKRLTF